MRNILLAIPFVFISLQFTACSTKSESVKFPVLFPSYPDEPKIEFLDVYRGGFTKKSSTLSDAFDSLIGEQKGEQSTESNMIKPYGVGLQDGKVYAVDTGTDTVFIMDEKTKMLELLGNGVSGRLSAPISVAFDSNKTVYVSDAQQKKIVGYDKQGNVKFVLGGRLNFIKPTGIAIDKELNRLYVVDTKAHMFKAFDLATKELIFSVGKRGRNDAEFNFPTNISVDRRNNNIAIVDTQNFRVQIFDKDGNFIRRFGQVGDKPGMFARPKGIGIDSEGHIYVTDTAFNNIQIFDENGQLLMWFGSAGYGDTQFRLITGLYIDENDKIVVADGFSGRVQTFQYLSEKWKIDNPIEYKRLKVFNPELIVHEKE